MAYAVIKTGGKQFVVEKGSTIRIPSVDAEAGKSIELDALLSSTEGDGAKVSGFSAFTRHSIACPTISRSSWVNPRGSPSAILI